MVFSKEREFSFLDILAKRKFKFLLKILNLNLKDLKGLLKYWELKTPVVIKYKNDLSFILITNNGEILLEVTKLSKFYFNILLKNEFSEMLYSVNLKGMTSFLLPIKLISRIIYNDGKKVLYSFTPNKCEIEFRSSIENLHIFIDFSNYMNYNSFNLYDFLELEKFLFSIKENIDPNLFSKKLSNLKTFQYLYLHFSPILF